jgi:hypothetical protein
VKRKIKKQITVVLIATLLVASVLLVSTASATVTPTGWKVGKTVAGTTLDFTSSFLVTGETSPDITIKIDNVGTPGVDQGITVTGVEVNKCTPKPKDCKADVSPTTFTPSISIPTGSTGIVTVTVTPISDNVKNVHLWVMIDSGIGSNYHIGVNVHFR